MGSAAAVTLKATICAVMVVPTFAPKITPTDWTRVMRPALTKPTTSTVVTDEDWIIAVTRAPVNAPVTGLRVSFVSRIFICSPAAAFRPSVIFSMPYRKSASPPNRPTPMASGFRGAGTPSSAAALSGQSRKATMSAPRTNVCGNLHRNGANPDINNLKGRDHKLWAPHAGASLIFFHFFWFIFVLRFGEKGFCSNDAEVYSRRISRFNCCRGRNER